MTEILSETYQEATPVEKPGETSSSDSEVESKPLKRRKHRSSISDSDIPLKKRAKVQGSEDVLSSDSDEELTQGEHKQNATKTKREDIKGKHFDSEEETLPLSDAPFGNGINDSSDSESDSSSPCDVSEEESVCSENTASGSPSEDSSGNSDGGTALACAKGSRTNENAPQHVLHGSLRLAVKLIRCDGDNEQSKEISAEKTREHKESPIKARKSLKEKRRKKSDAESDENAHSDSECTKSSQKGSKSSGKHSSHLRQLLKIQRASGIFLWYPTVFKDCTEKQKIKKVKEILYEAGMRGQPTMKKAEELKLKKEAAELDTGNIICVQGRSRRSRVTESEPEPVKEDTEAIKKTFSRLKDIVDSEDSSD